MSISVQPKIAGLDALEMGIRTLKRSKLLVAPEFKDMLFAVERHHNDLQMAHLTGKAKDLLIQAQRDTKFYNILVKMLCEIKEKRTGEQRQGLRRVYTWYMANKHVLSSGPRFGKEKMMMEAKEVLVKASTPRKAKQHLSARWGGSQLKGNSASLRNRAKSAPSVRIPQHNSTWRTSSFDWQEDLHKWTHAKEQPQIERLRLEQDDEEEQEGHRTLQGQREENDAAQNTPLNTADTITTANSELLQEARMLSRVHHGSPTMTPLGEQSPNVEATSVTPRKIVHPISSMVNPHVALAAQLEWEKQEKLKAKQRQGEKSRADNLQAWQNFNKNRSYGQDFVNRMNFVGRSGTPNDVRYFSHEQAEAPELYSQYVINGYVHIMAAEDAEVGLQEGSKIEEHKENVFANKTLEEFYEAADALYPPRETRPMSRARAKSAPSVGRSSSLPSRPSLSATHGPDSPRRKTKPQLNKLGHLLHDMAVKEEELDATGHENKTSVKLDAVVNIIDSVSDEMTQFKERMAPEAQPGFRLPMASGLPTSAVTESSAQLLSPSARSNSPVHSPSLAQHIMRPSPPRPYSSPLVTRQVQIVDETGNAAASPRRPKDRCKSAGVIDWRGRVQPDTMRYKWGRTKFGGYTYLKKHQQRPPTPSLRSAGSTSAGKRPKTAPISVRDKWKTDKASDANSRVEAQAASHSMTQIDQQDVDNMVTVQYLLGTSNSSGNEWPVTVHEPGADSLASLYSLDEEFLRSLRQKVSTPVYAPLEYMSFVSCSPVGRIAAERRAHAQDFFENRPNIQERDQEEFHNLVLPNLEDLAVPDGADSEGDLFEGGSVTGEVGEDQHHLPSQRTDLQGQFGSVVQEQFVQEAAEQEDVAPSGDVSSSLFSADKADVAVSEGGAVTHITSVVPDGKPPTHPSTQKHRRQPLSVSQVWQFSPSGDEEEIMKPGFIVGPTASQWSNSKPLPRKQVLCADCITMASTEQAPSRKVQRSAGRIPGQSYNASAQMVHFSRRHDELMRRVPPPRTPPSIPGPKVHSLSKDRSPRSGPMLMELEHHARKAKSPHSLMQHVKDLRSSSEARDISTAPSLATDSLMDSLQVCRLQVPLSRQRSMPTIFTYNDRSTIPDGLQSILKQSSELDLPSEGLPNPEEANALPQTEKSVTFDHGIPVIPTSESPEKPMESSEHFENGLQMPDSMNFMRQLGSGNSSLQCSKSISLQNSQLSSRNSSEPCTPTSKNLARIGRPIAQVAHVPDPGEVARAVQKQKEAAAAVDIQRIFRGYVARNAYKKLLSDERRRLEDKQRAAVEIQRIYRGHLSRKRAIERRPPDSEMLEWAREYRAILIANHQQRQNKLEERAEELADNYVSAQSKLSVIGPHVNIYEIYHPKRTGPSKKELHMAAVTVQRHVRGWLVRRRFDKLHRKAAWYGSTFNKLVKEYKGMLARVQRQHGIERPQVHFSTKDMSDYIDTRRRFESVFEKKAYAGELELVEVEAFFKECDLYPSAAEIDEAVDVAVRGSQGRGLKRHEVLDVVFYIYTPKAAGLVNTRQSTWMNPIIDGVEAKRLIGSEFVEDAPLEVCARLVINSKRERREKEEAAERARKEAEEEELFRNMSQKRSKGKQAVEQEGEKQVKVSDQTNLPHSDDKQDAEDKEQEISG